MSESKNSNDTINTMRKGFVSQDEIEWEIIDNGVRRKILSYDENLMVAVSEFKKGAIGVVHTHPHRQVTFISKGRFEVQLGKEKKILKKGDSFLIDPSLNHGVIAIEDSVLVDVFSPYREDFLSK
jgi:quercetin dioxygenase-like cupin family protein